MDWLLLVPVALGLAVPAAPPAPLAHTYSIVARDPNTGEMGVAVQSHYFSVGPIVPWAEAGVGAVATQSLVLVDYGPNGLAAMRAGLTAQQALDSLVKADAHNQGRQVAMVDARGNVAAYTGPRATPWAGDRQGPHVTAQGNILAGPGVVDSMIAAYNRTEGSLAFKLVAALEAGQAAGGDTRGKQSAALLIVKKCGGVWLHNDVVLRLQVDDNPEPIAELRRLVEKAPQRARGVTDASRDPACR